MTTTAQTMVLIPGAWMGSWVWDDVAHRLRANGFQVLTPTLAELDGEGDVSAVGLGTHVEQVEQLLAEHDLRSTILVGHSYSGLVAGQVADRQPSRVAHTVFVQAFLPRQGRSLIDDWSDDPDARAAETAALAERGGRWAAPITGLSAEPDLTQHQRDWLARHFVDHPGRSITEPAQMSQPLEALSATYIASIPNDTDPLPAHVQALVTEPSWHIERVRAGHWPMVSIPDTLTTLLSNAARRAEQ